MYTPILLIPPVINVIVTGLFAGVVLRQYLSRHRLYQLYWSIALSMAFVATLAYILMLVVQPTSPAGMLLFRTYYTFGGALMPAWLGLGSIALAFNPTFTRICFSILLLLSLIAAIFTLDATINLQTLSHIAGTPGTGTLHPGPWLVMTIILNTLGTVAIAGVAIYSGWKLLRRQSNLGGIRTSNILWANVLILVGALLNATAGTLAGILGVESTFWLIMAVGWVVLFAGVLLANRRSQRTKEPVPTQDTEHPVKA